MRILLPPNIWDEVMKGGRVWKGKWPFLGKRLGKFPRAPYPSHRNCGGHPRRWDWPFLQVETKGIAR